MRTFLHRLLGLARARGCAAARNRGTCSNRKTIPRTLVEERVLGGLRDRLMHPDLVAEFIAEFQRATQAERLEAMAARAEAERKLGKVRREIYARKVTDLVAALNDTETKPEAASILRGLIGKIVLTPDAAAANGHAIELFGELGAILSLCDNGMGVNAKARTGGAGLRQVTMVAGAGFEPAAFRL